MVLPDSIPAEYDISKRRQLRLHLSKRIHFDLVKIVPTEPILKSENAGCKMFFLFSCSFNFS